MKLAGAWDSVRTHVPLFAAMALAATIGLAGCDGDDGRDGTDGSAGMDGLNCWDLNENGVKDLPDEDLNNDGVVDTNDCNGLIGTGGDRAEALAKVEVESCSTCHSEAGQRHQDIYAAYADESKLVLTIDDVTSAADGAGTFTVSVDFSITFDGAPYNDPGLSQLDQKRFYAVRYDETTGQYIDSQSLSLNGLVSNGGGSYTLTQTGVAYAPEVSNAHVYGYVADGVLVQNSSATGSELPRDSSVKLYDDESNAALAFGTAAAGDPDAYDSAANVAGCEKCHGSPYLKHGYRAAVVENIPDFAACKSCHYDDRNGGHVAWQWMVDDPLAWATTADPADPSKYAYRATVMNDVHMSHAMEFPYPTSMSNCSTCHEGKLDRVLDDQNFVAETCKSCHAVEGVNAKEGEKYAQELRAPPLYQIWEELGQSLLTLHVSALSSTSPDQCTQCHGAAGLAPGFAALHHGGYNDKIYQADGTRYADLNTVSIDDVSLDGNLMTVDFSSNNPDVVPEVLISFYGWNTKHFYIPSHDYDGNTDLCPGGRRPGCQLEYEPESSGGGANALFTENEGSVPGDWSVTVDLGLYALTQTDLAEDLPGLIEAGVLKRAEVSLTPTLEVDGVDVALNATSKTVVLADGSIDDNYFKGDNSVVIEESCDTCHDTLASTFHDGSGRGGGGIQVCKHCHNPTYGGSHLEMQSRSIESYTHAIHTFQDFDVGDIFEEFDPVFAKRYDQHINHVFPNFTIRNCEACHNDSVVTYNVPSQSESLFGVQSASDTVDTWYSLNDDDLAVEDPSGRNIGSVPSYITGPASRTCGSCHRARFINDDGAGELASFNAHTDAFGTLVEEQSPSLIYEAINKVMEMFQ
jgi:OmcA/MtrC family decaheme c-type cytochrome